MGFGTHAVPRLAMSMADASEGVRAGNETTCGPATVFSTGVPRNLGYDLASRIVHGVGDEALNKGTGIQILVNGPFFSANWYLQKQMLKTEAGFDGIIMTDWGGRHSTLAIANGCGLQVP